MHRGKNVSLVVASYKKLHSQEFGGISLWE